MATKIKIYKVKKVYVKPSIPFEEAYSQFVPNDIDLLENYFSKIRDSEIELILNSYDKEIRTLVEKGKLLNKDVIRLLRLRTIY